MVFLKYTLGSGFFAGLDIALLYIFTEYLGIYHIYSSVISFVICLILGFLYQKHYTFADKSDKIVQNFIKFALFQLGSYGIYVSVLWTGVDYMGFYYIYVAGFAKGISFVWNFVMNYYFNFKS